MKSPTYYRIQNTDYIVTIDENNCALGIELNRSNRSWFLQILRMLMMLFLMIGAITSFGNSHANAPGKIDLVPKVKKSLTSQLNVSTEPSLLVTPVIYHKSEPIQATTQKTIDFWFGGSHLDKEELAITIDQVIDDLNITATTKKGKARKFLLEIAAIESDLGLIVKQHRGPAQGIFQILPSTFNAVLPKLKKEYPDLYQVIMGYYVSNQSKDWNQKYNVKFGAAFSLTYCYLVTKFELDSKLDTRAQRAAIYKKKYNTNDHAYLIPRYYSRAKKHEI